MPRYDYDLAFLDFETRSPIDLKLTGVDKYSADPDTDVLCLGWLMDDDAGHLWSPEFYWDGDNSSLIDLHNHVYHGGLVVAWNARFDRKIWNEVCVPEYDWPEIPLEQWLCAQAQGEANNLPAMLAKAAECLRVDNKKDSKGKSLIGALSFGTRAEWSTVLRAKQLMTDMRGYCLDDNKAMRDIWKGTRPLSLDEWAEYHASERINDRGVAVDVDFALAAQAYAAAEQDDVNQWMQEITGDPEIRITHHIRKAQWLHKALEPAPELQKICEKPVRGKDVDGNPNPPKISADRATRDTLIEVIDNDPFPRILGTDTRNDVVDFLEAVEAGNSAAVYKFRAIAHGSIDGRLFGQYSFNGAGQTGRFSGRGVQVHNLIRAAVDKDNSDAAIDAIDAIMEGAEADSLVEKFGLPISRLLARLLRPSFIAPEGKTLVWADWDQIEARTLPWLANNPGGQRILDAFERGEDIYVIAAAGIFNKAESDISDDERQVGKVAVLALGFGGGVGAFRAMARGYGVVMSDQQMEDIVKSWRDTNRWASTFWDELRSAVYSAYREPMTWYQAGRVKYLFHPDLMYGTLICVLPCGRWLVYPQFKEVTYLEHEDGSTVYHGSIPNDEYNELLDTDDNFIERTSLSFVKGFNGGYSRVKCWHGTFAENVTQAYAASLLRAAIKQADDEGLKVVLHTHDELVIECFDENVDVVYEALEDIMTDDRGHAMGLPLSVSVEHGPYYTK